MMRREYIVVHVKWRSYSYPYDLPEGELEITSMFVGLETRYLEIPSSGRLNMRNLEVAL